MCVILTAKAHTRHLCAPIIEIEAQLTLFGGGTENVSGALQLVPASVPPVIQALVIQALVVWQTCTSAMVKSSW